MLDSKKLEDIAYFAGNLMSISEVSRITGIDKSDEHFQNEYWKAWYITEAQINEKIKALAISGSSSAQQLALDIMKQKL